MHSPRQLEDAARALDVDPLRDLARHAQVVDRGEVVDRGQLVGERAVLAAGEPEVHVADVALEQGRPRARLLVEPGEELVGRAAELGAHQEVDPASGGLEQLLASSAAR